MVSIIKYCRKCPKCKKILYYNNKYTLQRQLKKNSNCNSCTQKGRTYEELYGIEGAKLQKEKLSKSHIGQIAWNKGIPCKIETKNKLKKINKNQIPPNIGKKHKFESIEKMKLSHKGQIPINKGKTLEEIVGKYRAKKIKRKMRLKNIENIQNRVGQISPNYNPKSIPILEQKAKELGITDLQHAENGGEFHIKELGYWVDGYSPSKNTVIEIDEKHHFDITGKLKEKDINRQKEIEKLLKCNFLRIKYNNTKANITRR